MASTPTPSVPRVKSIDLMEGPVSWVAGSQMSSESRRPLPKFVTPEEVFQSQHTALTQDLANAKVSQLPAPNARSGLFFYCTVTKFDVYIS